MYIDKQLLFSDSQALTATAVSTNVVDLGVDGNVGIGEPMAVYFGVEVAADDANADETYVAEIQASSDEAFTSPVALGSLTIAAGAAAGTKYAVLLPADGRADQYIRVSYTLGGTTPSVTLSAFMIPANMIQNDVYYADAITIS